ncbi:hypothetical protein P280DRAFT_486906 [Massarina eburnea CBS 473.64]|uniref:Rho-GAP domain-containing protein n=1 Tax=Massarina eburnea CBS 473.64 TaxID=1395130 RepID=A0A6A6SFG1_9PLEO|nr:hypothetical protein P280DRAFT_486906 [Massarina eburnea CBS 473.64]
MPKSSSLSLNSSSLSLAMRPKTAKESTSSPRSPMSPGSPSAINGDTDAATPPISYQDTPRSPASPKPRKDSKNIFSNFTANRSSPRIAGTEPSIRQGDGYNRVYANGRSGASTPDLSRPVYTPNSDGKGPRSGAGRAMLKQTDMRSDSGYDPRNGGRKLLEDDPYAKRGGSKPKKQGMLGRSTSTNTEETRHKKLNKSQPAQLSPDAAATWNHNGDSMALKTAPLEKDKSWRGNIPFGKLRTHSADRHEGSSQHAHRNDDNPSRKDKTEQSSVASGSFNESRGAQIMSNFGLGAKSMGKKLDSARKGVFGKLARSASNHETAPQAPKEPYQFKIIHTPLVEQTRLTRISNRLENSKDKTEFWMPALPWRCIDYLNMRGCEEEGLYRVPGAAHQIRYYEQKFDQVRDIDLIAEDDLNDPNVIGSLFKNWLRQLPDEIFPKATQSRIQQECQGAKTTPQLLKDELSRLPPFNYYLLFAITCHISLLHSCSEFNKMNYNNLCICFQPAIRIDAFCFQFLILDWRNCWQGCWTEKEYLVEEVKLLAAQNPREAPPNPQSSYARNGHSAKAKGSQPLAYLGDGLKSSGRKNSGDRAKPSSSRGVSSDRSLGSGRATPPNSSIVGSEKSSSSKRGTSADRAPSSSDSREAFSARSTPNRPTVKAGTKAETADDDDNSSATPTQAQHSRGLSSKAQYRLSNPPNSPFDIKFN